ncbi:WAT1-related protein [Platanthera guangdongensis]|uniref:WAT1-related protein n=1 Tax=Platanthera guangdongensis TaxID=2320717 RepID=A0ABR2LHL9_9ASPA
MGAQQTSAGFASSLENIIPSIALLIALLFRVEKIDIRQRHGQAKIIGAVVTIAGTIIMILYKGPAVEFFWTNGRQPQQQNKHESNDYNRISGTLMLLVSFICWAFFLLLQSNTLKSYPAKVTLTIYICSLGALMNFVMALLGGARSLEPWILGWDMRIFAVIYSGVVCTGLSYFILGMVMMKKGPVFAGAFNPLTMVLTVVLSSIFLAEKTALGTIIGATVIVIGLYSLLWGESKGDPSPLKNEGKVVEERELPEIAPSEQRPIEMTLNPIFEQKHHKEENSFIICCDKYITESRPSVH